MSGTGATETQNIATVRRGFDAFAKGDVETLKTLIAPSANWNAPETGVLKGNYKGVQAILQYFGQLGSETGGTMRAEPLSIAASGDRVFVLERATGKRRGKTLDTNSVLVFELKNGVVTEVTECQSDHPAMVQFWS